VRSLILFKRTYGQQCLFPLQKTYRKNKNIEAHYERDKFIQAGFKQICCINDAFLWQQKADEFKRTCLAFWQFDFVRAGKGKIICYRAEWQSGWRKNECLRKKSNIKKRSKMKRGIICKEDYESVSPFRFL